MSRESDRPIREQEMCHMTWSNSQHRACNVICYHNLGFFAKEASLPISVNWLAVLQVSQDGRLTRSCKLNLNYNDQFRNVSGKFWNLRIPIKCLRLDTFCRYILTIIQGGPYNCIERPICTLFRSQLIQSWKCESVGCLIPGRYNDTTLYTTL